MFCCGFSKDRSCNSLSYVGNTNQTSVVSKKILLFREGYCIQENLKPGLFLNLNLGAGPSVDNADFTRQELVAAAAVPVVPGGTDHSLPGAARVEPRLPRPLPPLPPPPRQAHRSRIRRPGKEYEQSEQQLESLSFIGM